MGSLLLDSPLSSALEVDWIREQYPDLTALPRWATRRNLDRETMGPELRKAALDLGFDLMPWQRLVADVAGELDPDGSPHYQIVVVTIHRQGGKTTLILAVESHRCLVWARPQRVVYAAQNRGSAREKLIEDQIPMLEASLLGDLGRKRLAAGSEAWRWSNGSRIGLQSNTKKAGHGLTNDLVVLDEAFAQVDWRHEQSLLPTMATKQDWQWWTFSTAGDETSLYLLDKVRRGRHLVETGRDARIAYLEWSVPEDADIDDPATWLRYLPAVGLTIRTEELQTFRANMPDDEFRRAFGNQWRVQSAEERPRVITAAAWDAMADRSSRRDPAGFGRLALDAAPDGSTCSIGIAVKDTGSGKVHVEAIETRPGLAWAPRRVKEMLARPGREQFDRRVALSLKTCGSLVPDLERQDGDLAGVQVDPLPQPEWDAACASFLTGVHEAAYVHIADPELDAAVASADQSFSGDGWHWNRRGTEPISPLCSVTVAAWALKKATDDYDLLNSFY